MDSFLIKVLIGLLLAAFVAILPLILIFLMTRKKSNRSVRSILIFLLSVLQSWIFYSIYTAFYPEDSFYLEEYKTVVGKPAPKSAQIIDKSASYPDFHGSYNSVSVIKLSDIDYDNLYREINQDKNFGKAELIHTETLKDILDSNKNVSEIAWKEHKNSDEDWHHRFIGFLNNQKTIIIYYLDI